MGNESSQYEDEAHFSKKEGEGNKSWDSIDEEAEAEVQQSRDAKTKKSSKKGRNPISDQDRKLQRELIANITEYLEIVGEHSENLPLTWRDDPELGRTVSSLTSNEYAKKADAFVPSDVRIIGGTSNKYGRSWEIPQTFMVQGRNIEPYYSQGGPCANVLLKVLYDYQNEDEESNDGYDDFVDQTDNLFDDDDDDVSDVYNRGVSQSESVGSLAFDNLLVGSALTWGDLMRRMKDEMEDQGYQQTPTLCTSRRFELNEPVGLVSPDFDPAMNRKFSVLIGCNYKGTEGSLQKSHEDICSIKDYITNVHGFPEDEESMIVLLDDQHHKARKMNPTKSNILQAFQKIAQKSQPGDAVFVQFSGHGGRVLDANSESEVDCYDEVLLPCDYEQNGTIPDTLVFKHLLAPMSQDVTVTIILDSANTGFMCDMPYSWQTRHDKAETRAKLTLNDSFSFVRYLNVVKSMYELTKSGDATLDEENFPEVEESDGEESLVTVGEDDEEEEEDEEASVKVGLSDDDDSDIDEYESKIRSKPNATERVEKIKNRGKGALQAFKTAISCSHSSSQELDDRNDQAYNRGTLSADSYDDYSASSGEWSD